MGRFVLLRRAFRSKMPKSSKRVFQNVLFILFRINFFFENFSLEVASFWRSVRRGSGTNLLFRSSLPFNFKFSEFKRTVLFLNKLFISLTGGFVAQCSWEERSENLANHLLLLFPFDLKLFTEWTILGQPGPSLVCATGFVVFNKLTLRQTIQSNTYTCCLNSLQFVRLWVTTCEQTHSSTTGHRFGGGMSSGEFHRLSEPLIAVYYVQT